MNTESPLSGHISKRFDNELEAIINSVLTMGGLVETQLNDGILALMESDSTVAEKVANGDNEINAMEIEIDEQCLQILARRQPAASDLRLVVTIMKTITDLERIGDKAQKLGIFELELIDKGSTSSQYAKLEHLGNLVSKMLHNALNSFARLDDHVALKTIKKDKKVNSEFESLNRQLITIMMEDPRNIKNALRVSWCARALERVGDHAQNICENVLFLKHGKDVRHIDYKEVKRQLSKESY